MFAPRRQSDREYLDTPGQDPTELSGLLTDIRRTNRRFGGSRLILRSLRRVTPAVPTRPITLLDVATASADIPCAIAAWGRARGEPFRIVALDLSDAILSFAQHDAAAYPEITLIRADALSLPFPDGAFDVVICGLALHHFTFDDATQVLREIDRVARHAFVVNDIERSWAAYLGAWLDTRILSRNRLARHDGPLSVRRSFTLEEFRTMIRLAGLQDVEIQKHPLFRVAIVRWPQPELARVHPLRRAEPVLSEADRSSFDRLRTNGRRVEGLAQDRRGTGNG